MRASFLSAGLAAALLLAACREARPPAGAAGETASPRRSERESYRPPTDGILTAPQVEMFLKVREETVKSRRASRPDAPLEGEEGISGASDARAAEI